MSEQSGIQNCSTLGKMTVGIYIGDQLKVHMIKDAPLALIPEEGQEVVLPAPHLDIQGIPAKVIFRRRISPTLIQLGFRIYTVDEKYAAYYRGGLNGDGWRMGPLVENV